MKSIISSRNIKINKLNPTAKSITLARYVDNQCLTLQLIYQVDVTNSLDDERKYYLGLAEATFKERYDNHKSSFENENSRKSTELSKYVCSLSN